VGLELAVMGHAPLIRTSAAIGCSLTQNFLRARPAWAPKPEKACRALVEQTVSQVVRGHGLGNDSSYARTFALQDLVAFV
jgi:hypothetical protein